MAQFLSAEHVDHPHGSRRWIVGRVDEHSEPVKYSGASERVSQTVPI
jgi:hypothetical protein